MKFDKQEKIWHHTKFETRTAKRTRRQAFWERKNYVMMQLYSHSQYNSHAFVRKERFCIRGHILTLPVSPLHKFWYCMHLQFSNMHMPLVAVRQVCK